MEPHRPTLQVHLLPALIPSGALKGGVAVVVDVLRATTCMVHALAAGCEQILPCGEVDEARATAAQLPKGSYFLAGERQGVPIEGFAMGNSPGDCTPERCRGKTMVMTTTNGTRAILASQEADRVLIGAFVNFRATFEAVVQESRPIHVVCSGTDGQVSLEDTAFAGALVAFWCAAHAKKSPTLIPEVNDAGLVALGQWESIGNGIDRAPSFNEGLARSLAEGRGGRRVKELGYEADIVRAASFDHFNLRADLRRNPLRIVQSP